MFKKANRLAKSRAQLQQIRIQQTCKVQRPCQQNKTLLRQPRLPRAPHPPLTAQQLEELYLLTPRASTQPSSASLQALHSRSSILTLKRTPPLQTTTYSTQGC